MEKPILFLCSIEDLISTIRHGFPQEASLGLRGALFLPTDPRCVGMWHLTANEQVCRMMLRLIIKAENSGRIEWSVTRNLPYVTARAVNNLLARNFGPEAPRLRERFLPKSGRPEPFGPLNFLSAQDDLQLPVRICTKPVDFPLSIW